MRHLTTLLAALLVVGPAARAAAPPSPAGRLVAWDVVGAIPSAEGAHRMFAHWAVRRGRPLALEFRAGALREYRLFLGFTEAHWKMPGQRIVEVRIGGKKVDTLDTFLRAPNVAHGRVYLCRSDREGLVRVEIAPAAGSPDPNPVLCGALLFPGSAAVSAEDVVAGRGPRPLATVETSPDAAARYRAKLFGRRGLYFHKKRYAGGALPTYEGTKALLPRPVFDEEPAWVEVYDKVWEIAFTRFRRPREGSPFVSNYIDEAFNPSLFLWDTCFMTMFCNYAHRHVPGIISLDNFYATQLEDGEIVREVLEATGDPHAASQPGTPHSLNHPILAWAEWESYRISGDRDRLRAVWEPLVRYYRAYEKIRDPASGLYLGSWASMDNSPRLPGMLCSIDTSAEVALFARDLARIARAIGREDDAARYEREAKELGGRIDRLLWDEEEGFYFDWRKDGTRHDVWTIAGYWPLLAEIPSPERRERLVDHLRDPRKFARLHRVPTVPADQEGYDPKGGYWRGAVWAPTDMMVVRALDRSGHVDLAREIAMNHLRAVGAVYRETGTVWENYAPDALTPGWFGGHRVKRDFVGWTGIGPVLFLIEFAIGIRVDAPARRVVWRLESPKRCGVERLAFGDVTATLMADAVETSGDADRRAVSVRSDRAFTLELRWRGGSRTIEVRPGVEAHVVLSRPR